MSRTRMTWDWIREYPIFIYTRFINQGICHVKVIRGQKGDQNAEGTGPLDKAWFEYKSRGLYSKHDVTEHALEKARERLEKTES